MDTDKQNSVYLTAFLSTETLLVIITKDAEQVQLVRRLFKPEHRTQVRQGTRWHVRSLDLYKDIPVVEHAIKAYRLQYTLDGKCPVISQP